MEQSIKKMRGVEAAITRKYMRLIRTGRAADIRQAMADRMRRDEESGKVKKPESN